MTLRITALLAVVVVLAAAAVALTARDEHPTPPQCAGIGLIGRVRPSPGAAVTDLVGDRHGDATKVVERAHDSPDEITYDTSNAGIGLQSVLVVGAGEAWHVDGACD